MTLRWGTQLSGGALVWGLHFDVAGAGTLTSSWLSLNNGAPHVSAPFTAYVYDMGTGQLVVVKTGLTTYFDGVVDGVPRYRAFFIDAALAIGVQYAVRWVRTDTMAQGVELLTAT